MSIQNPYNPRMSNKVHLIESARDCAWCKKAYQPKRTKQRFCSTPCRNSFHKERMAQMYKRYREDLGAEGYKPLASGS